LCTSRTQYIPFLGCLWNRKIARFAWLYPDFPGRRQTLIPSSVMMREQWTSIFCLFRLYGGCLRGIGRFFKRTAKTIRALTVRDILDEAKMG